MGGGSVSSSKQKSSSLKKKYSSTQDRKKKRSKSRIKKNKSKRLRHRDVSISSSDNDDSASLSSSSSSSSDDDYKRRRSRSRTRKNTKKSKKSRRKYSSSSESSHDVRKTKKRKRSRKYTDSDTKKKSDGKKRRREVSVSSTSRSTCEEKEYDKLRVRIERVEKEKTNNDYDHESEVNLTGLSNLPRLRSVITVLRNDEDLSEFDYDMHKEEIIYDHDEYPSSRSNDSNNEEVKSEDDIVSSFITSEIVAIDENDRYDGNYLSPDIRDENDEIIKNKIEDKSTDTGSHDQVNLELILRQRALEKFKKFRGCIQIKTTDIEKANADVISHKEDDVMEPSGARVVDQTKGPTTTTMIQDVDRPPRVVMTGHSKASENISTNAVYVKPKPGTLICKREPTVNTSSKENQLGFDGNLNENEGEIANTMLSSRSNNGEQIDNTASGSADPGPSSIKTDSKEQCIVGEGKDGSQYEQKTMSVMRGGEMVQVNYKVFIPKKTPALARRQLRR